MNQRMNIRMMLREDPELLDKLIKLMAFVKKDEAQLGRKWTQQDWRCLEAVVHAKEKKE